MRILLLGGSKSGKSMMGQHMARRLSGGESMYYWATLEPRDGEDRAIVRRHLAERDGWGFEICRFTAFYRKEVFNFP